MSNVNDNQRWLAYELHDSLMPWIHGARMLVSQLQVVAQSADNLATANHCLNIAAEEGRALIGFLESCDRDSCDRDRSFTLVSGFAQFIEVARPLANAAQQEIVLHGTLAIPNSLSPAQSWSILRVLQQAVQNAIQHAGPCQIQVTSRVAGDSWILAVADTGVGFDQNAPRSNCYGLSSMQQRAQAWRGRVEIESRPGSGTTITLHVPKPTSGDSQI